MGWDGDGGIREVRIVDEFEGVQDEITHLLMYPFPYINLIR
jgi:hypothetical protein